jgi:hypothetical protein
METHAGLVCQTRRGLRSHRLAAHLSRRAQWDNVAITKSAAGLFLVGEIKISTHLNKCVPAKPDEPA